jgi:hypothetical protein
MRWYGMKKNILITRVRKYDVREKPCHILQYCPYGSLIEHMPLAEKEDDRKSCSVFGHRCAVFGYAQIFVDDAG